jgi:hypothetical protein
MSYKENGFTYKKAYICHPYTAGDKNENIESVKKICKYITELENKNVETNTSPDKYKTYVVSIAPHLLFPEFMSEPTLGREVAMNFCKALLLGCDEIWVYYGTKEGMSSGMREEVSFAGAHGIPIVFKGENY